MAKPFYTRKELAYENYITNKTAVETSYDPNVPTGTFLADASP